jgi:hypothetical protein
MSNVGILLNQNAAHVSVAMEHFRIKDEDGVYSCN